MKYYIWEVCSIDVEDTMNAERRIAVGNRANGAFAALMRRRNRTAARFAVHNAALVPTLL